MSVQLLDKTRKINKLLHNNNSSKVVFNDICEVLTGILDSDILVISKKGKVLGSSVCKGVDELQELIVDEGAGVCLLRTGQRLPAPPLPAPLHLLHRHPRQRHHPGLVQSGG